MNDGYLSRIDAARKAFLRSGGIPQRVLISADGLRDLLREVEDSWSCRHMAPLGDEEFRIFDLTIVECQEDFGADPWRVEGKSRAMAWDQGVEGHLVDRRRTEQQPLRGDDRRR